MAHEGIDTEQLAPDPEAALHLPDGRVLKAGEPIITYVARNLEPYRTDTGRLRAYARVCLPTLPRMADCAGDRVQLDCKRNGCRHRPDGPVTVAAALRLR